MTVNTYQLRLTCGDRGQHSEITLGRLNLFTTEGVRLMQDQEFSDSKRYRSVRTSTPGNRPIAEWEDHTWVFWCPRCKKNRLRRGNAKMFAFVDERADAEEHVFDLSTLR